MSSWWNRHRRRLLVGLGVLSLMLVLRHIHQFTIHAATCFSVAEVQADTRCLYIYNNQVYEKGTRANPHHGNACGSDVTAIIPSFHYMNMAKYLDPTYQGNICEVIPTDVPVVPTDVPTAPTAVPATCATKAQGDANCDGAVSLVDYEIWHEEYAGVLTTHTADFDTAGTNPPSIADFEIWRTTFLL